VNFSWWMWLLLGLAGAGVGIVIVMQTSWYKVRKYALDIKRIYDKHKLQEKAEAVQAISQTPNPNPVLMRKPIRELTATYEALIADMNKLKVPPKASTLHELSLNVAKESLAMYQMAAVGGFRQKAMMEKQKKVQKMQEQIQTEMEKLYGPMKKK
jgi:TorA maturation chaperone TorD